MPFTAFFELCPARTLLLPAVTVVGPNIRFGGNVGVDRCEVVQAHTDLLPGAVRASCSDPSRRRLKQASGGCVPLRASPRQLLGHSEGDRRRIPPVRFGGQLGVRLGQRMASHESQCFVSLHALGACCRQVSGSPRGAWPEAGSLHHPEASAGLRAERGDEVARLGHRGHGVTVDAGRVTTTLDLQGPLLRCVGVAHPLKSSDAVLTALILGYLAPWPPGFRVADVEPTPRERSLRVEQMPAICTGPRASTPPPATARHRHIDRLASEYRHFESVHETPSCRPLDRREGR